MSDLRDRMIAVLAPQEDMTMKKTLTAGWIALDGLMNEWAGCLYRSEQDRDAAMLRWLVVGSWSDAQIAQKKISDRPTIKDLIACGLLYATRSEAVSSLQHEDEIDGTIYEPTAVLEITQSDLSVAMSDAVRAARKAVAA